MRISDWSSDVCSSDLLGERRLRDECLGQAAGPEQHQAHSRRLRRVHPQDGHAGLQGQPRLRHALLALRRRHRRWRGEGLVRGARLLRQLRSEEHTSELQSLMRISYAVFCLKKKKQITNTHYQTQEIFKNIRIQTNLKKKQVNTYLMYSTKYNGT